MAKFRLQANIDAVAWDGNADTANKFIGDKFHTDWWFLSRDEPTIILETRAGTAVCHVGDWLVKDSGGKCYPLPPTVFESLFTLG